MKTPFVHCLMRCLFAVSSWFVQRASLTVYIDPSDVTNKYYTVLYRTVVVYEKKNRSLVFSGSRKIPTLGSTVQWETRQASFPTGTVGPRVGIFLSPLNTNDGFYLSHSLLTQLTFWNNYLTKTNNKNVLPSTCITESHLVSTSLVGMLNYKAPFAYGGYLAVVALWLWSILSILYYSV